MTLAVPPHEGRVGRIPVRNLWLQMLYASDLMRVGAVFDAAMQSDVEDLPDLIASLLADAVEKRLRKNLTRSYQSSELILKRVRGRIDILATEERQLFSRGEVFCRFEELTNDTARNRLVRAALDSLARLVRDSDLSRRCRTLATGLGRAGVGPRRPSRTDLAVDQIGRNDAGDKYMVALSRFAFQLVLPTELAGPTPLAVPDREDVWVRRLFEKAVLGFARVEFEAKGWRVRGGVRLQWQVSAASEGLAKILPGMITDIVLDPPGERRLFDRHEVCVDSEGRTIQRGTAQERVSLPDVFLPSVTGGLRRQVG